MNQRVVVAYIPVLHRGYMDFLAESGVQKIFLLEASDVPELSRFAREIRALRFEEASAFLKVLGLEAYRFGEHIHALVNSDYEFCMPNEDITRAVHAKYFQDKQVVFSDTFLRWDWGNSVSVTFSVTPEADRIIKKGSTEGDFVERYMLDLIPEQEKSSDWWRRIAGLAITIKGEHIWGYNHHHPHEYAPYFDGDPRNNFSPGEHIDVSSAIHAEASIIANAAKQGIMLAGADLFVTTFPCGGCARQIAESGIRRVFFTGGYSNLNGVETLRGKDVELIFLET